MSVLNFLEDVVLLYSFISFTGLITFSKDLLNVVKEVPLNKFMLETDSPYLIPKNLPKKPKKNIMSKKLKGLSKYSSI